MKKFASLLLAVVMILAMAVPAMAENNVMPLADEGTLPGSITITKAVVGQTYNVYQILYLESYDLEAGAYAYKANSAWLSWLKEQTTYVEVDDQNYVTWVDGADAAAFAKAAQAYATELVTVVDADGNPVLNDDSTEKKVARISPEATATATDTRLLFGDLSLGYYLIDTTLGTLCSLDTNTPDVTIEEKNEAPTVTKEVQEDSNNDWGETNDADINQVVNFKATITVQKGAENYILHDTMSAGLTYTGVTSVKIGDADVVADNYTVTAAGLTDGCTFEVAFDNDYIATLAAGTQIVVSYSATLNENAVVGLPGNSNEVKLQYGDKNQPSNTPADTTITYTWDAKVIKYTKDGDKEVVLADATFKLSTDEAGTNVIKFHSLGDNTYEVCADTACTKEHVTEITTDTTGTFSIEGLDAGTYYLTETAAPAGYNKLPAPKTVIITGATVDEETEELTYSTVETKVENKTGSLLPETGGMGTTMIYVAGGILVLGALIVLISKKRAAEEA